MAKRRVYEVNKKERYQMLDDFFEILSKLNGKRQFSNFFKDLLTPSEALMLTRRIAIAKLLLEGWSFKEIEEKMKVGTNTVNNVNRWLYTGFGGYMNALKEAKSKKEFREALPKNEWEAMKRKYPAHFFIFNAVDKIKNRRK